ncbi:MAG TPA: Uma2 family endonuclease [Acidimicrobiales bacterium]|nr:Uma2 family endonuclease [Acidimicrobiales bacterium]
MRAVMIEVPPHLLEERRRMGADRWDEMWEGELHMVPPPAERHQSLGARLIEVLGPIARARGLKVAYEIGLFLRDDDYRMPDLAVYRPDQASERGLEAAAELVVELVSPGDESRVKLPWYASLDVREVLLIARDSLCPELYRCDSGKPVPVAPAESATIGCRFEVAGPDILRVTTPAGAVDITP